MDKKYAAKPKTKETPEVSYGVKKNEEILDSLNRVKATLSELRVTHAQGSVVSASKLMLDLSNKIDELERLIVALK